MVRCVSGIVGMTEPDVRDDLFQSLHQVFICALDRLSGRYSRSGVSYEDVADAVRDSRTIDHLLNPVGYIDDLFGSAA